MPNEVKVELQHAIVGPAFSVRGSMKDMGILIEALDAHVADENKYSRDAASMLTELRLAYKAMLVLENR